MGTTKQTAQTTTDSLVMKILTDTMDIGIMRDKDIQTILIKIDMNRIEMDIINPYRYNGRRDNEGQRYTNNFHQNRYEQNINGYQQNRFQNNGRNYNNQPYQPNAGRENFNRGNQYNNNNGQERERNREINNLSLIREGEDEQGHQEMDNVEVESNRAGPPFQEGTH
uniref:GATA zinc finger domain-containing protein 14-like n=1 Tax=Diabrotica virgifera virgifera TaxID=50390 RepID=A0A6P7HEJ3_DIAVI